MTQQYPSRADVANALADAFRLKRIPATIIDRDQERPGYVIVEGKSTDGFQFRRSVPNMAVIPIQPGIAVLLGRDDKRRLVIKEPDIDQQIAAGVDPAINNPADRYYYAALNQDNLHTLYCAAVSTATVNSMEVVVFPWFWRDVDGTWFELEAQRFDFTDPAGDGSVGTLVPTGNTHRLVCLWVTDENTVSYTASTPKSRADDIDIADVQECQTPATLNWTPIRFWKVTSGMVTIKESDSWRDGRQVVNVGRGGSNSGSSGAPAESGTLTVTDGTTTIANVTTLQFDGDHFSVSGGSGVAVVISDFVGGSGGSGTDSGAIHVNVASEIYGITEKAAPVSNDLVVIEDSADGYNKKKVKISNLPSGGGGAPHQYIGTNSIGASEDTIVNWKHIFKKVTLTQDGTISSIGAYIRGAGDSNVYSFTAAIYADNAGVPGRVLAYHQPTPATNYNVFLGNIFEWVHMPIGRFFEAGDYWLAIIDTDNNIGIKIKYDTGGTDRTLTSGGAWMSHGGGYTQTDTTYNYSIRANFSPDSGSIIRIGVGVVKKPLLTDFTWVNQGSATAVQQTNSILVQNPGEASNARILKKTLPSTPYVITACIRSLPPAENYPLFGIGLRESSSGKLIFLEAVMNTPQMYMQVHRWTDANTLGASMYSRNVSMWDSDYWWMKISDNATTRKFEFSPDGENWFTALSEASGTYLTANEAFFGINSEGCTSDHAGALLSWEEA